MFCKKLHKMEAEGVKDRLRDCEIMKALLKQFDLAHLLVEDRS